MERMTAEQAAEAARGLTFEKVWAALMESRQSLEESQRETQRRMEESQRETQRRMEESQRETQRRMETSQRESQRRTDKMMADLAKNLGGLGNTLGRFTEAMCANGLYKKFRKLGYTFTKQGERIKFDEDGKLLAEVDFFLENGEYAMPVEIKTELTIEDVKDHLERIEKIRRYMDARDDKRKLVGAVAGGIVSESARVYAQRKGLYVIIQTGDSVVIADMPEGFKAREW